MGTCIAAEVERGAAGEGSSRSLYRRLRPGPGVPAAEIHADQRARLCGAMIHVLADQGYERAAMRDVCALAGVSSRTFYERFTGKLDCFMASHDLVVDGLTACIEGARDVADDSTAGLRVGFEIFTGMLASRPRAAWLALVEPYGAGPIAVSRMHRASERFAAVLAPALDDAEPQDAEPDGPLAGPDRELTARAIVAGAEHAGRLSLLGDAPPDAAALSRALVGWARCCQRPNAAVTAAAARPLPAVTRLPPPGMPRPVEGGDERSRLHAAAIALVLRGGQAQLGVRELAGEAHVSQARLRSLFQNPALCLQSAISERALVRLEAVAAAGRGGGEPADAPRRSLAALLALPAQDPDLARLLFVTLPALGRSGVATQARLFGRVGELLWAGPPRRRRGLHAQLGAGAICGLIAQRVTAGATTADLAAMAPTLSLIVLAPALGGAGN